MCHEHDPGYNCVLFVLKSKKTSFSVFKKTSLAFN